MDGPAILAGTADGLRFLREGSEGAAVRGRAVGAIARDAAGNLWLIADGRAILRRGRDGGWDEVSRSEGLGLSCIGATSSGNYVGTERARLLRLNGPKLTPVGAFDEVPGRDAWYTPWGGPPATRSIAEGPAGRLYVNVHVGGVLRSTDGGGTWGQTPLDIDADVHQVLAHPEVPEVVYAPAAVGLCWSADAGTSWTVETDGLHATYMRAVAVAGDRLLASASTGPGGSGACLYRVPLDGRGRPAGPFERCTDGLPARFSTNVDTGCLAASGGVAVVADPAGEVYRSEDEGASWARVASGLPEVRVLALDPAP